MLKTWLCGLGLAAGLMGGITAAWASAYPDADRYYAVRDASRAVKENVTFAQVQANAVPWKDALTDDLSTLCSNQSGSAPMRFNVRVNTGGLSDGSHTIVAVATVRFLPSGPTTSGNSTSRSNGMPAMRPPVNALIDSR